MPYIIENRSGEPIVIPDGSLNTDYSIDLVGRNYENYGQIIAKTQIDLLDNFATDNTPPADPTTGQLWYDKDNKVLRTYDGPTGSWLPNRPLVTTTPPTNQHGQNKAGTQYFNTDTGQLYINAGSTGYQIANKPGEISLAYSGDATLGNPNFYGTSLRNIFLTDTAGIQRAVLGIFYRNDGVITSTGYYDGEELIAVFSAHDTFEVADALSTTDGDTFNFYDQFSVVQSPGAIGLTIRPGINTRIDDQSTVNNSRLSARSSTAYSLNTGSYSLELTGSIDDNGGANIAAANIFHHGANSVPVVTNTYTLGETGNIFARSYVNNMYVGNTILSNGGSISIGNASDPTDNIFATNLNVYTGIFFPSGGQIASTGQRVTNISSVNIDIEANAIIAGYRLPTYTSTNGKQIYLNNVTGGTEWADPISNIKYITSSDGSVDLVESSSAETPVGSLSLNVRTIDFTSNVDYARGLISIDSGSSEDLAYDAANGIITYIRETPFDNLVPSTHFMLLEGEVDQIATGIKTFSASDTKIGGSLVCSGKVLYGSRAVFPASTNTSVTEFLKFETTDDSTNTAHSITFSKSGDITATGDITAFSDERLKENVLPIDDALNKVTQINGYTFNRIGDPTRHAGVLAQEIQQVLPEVITEDPDGMLSVAYGNIVGLLINAVKELKNEVDTLRQELGK